MPNLKTSVSELRGVGPATATKLTRLGIRSVADLLSHYPIRHEDLTHVTTVAGLRSNTTSVLRGRIQLIKARRGYRRRRMSITEGLFEDGSGTIRLVWFNQPYIATSYKPGDEVFLVGSLTNGSYGPQMQSPLVERVKDKQLLAGRILPVYRATAGLTQRQIRQLVELALPYATSIPDWMPADVHQAEKLQTLSAAVHDIHFPRTARILERARERLKFNELFLFTLALLQTEQLRREQSAPIVPFDQGAIRHFVDKLPFKLTTGQRKAAWDILQDLERNEPMYRLLEGDVGSGKTVVAAIAIRNISAHGLQAAVLAPTDILAGQHYATLSSFFATTSQIALLTGSRRAWTLPGEPTKAKIIRALADGTLDLVVGTHAILNDKVIIPKLALTVVDEQHRFGVEQRHALQAKRVDTVPHLLSMTATPIPRTLMLALYGDLKISGLHELPPGRTPVATSFVPSFGRAIIYDRIRQRAKAGEQTYIVCPLIEESDELGVTAATAEFERLQSEDLDGLRIGLLHGKMSGTEKGRILDTFANGQLDVLVATPVVEVGVDVPNATTIVIEGAERFGLAQLHQLRGRVGRSSKPSTCFLLSDSTDRDVRERLALVESTTNGFALAEQDLQRRGPGDVYGIRQSGLPAFKMASLTDISLMQRAHAAAQSILRRDPGLKEHDVLAKKSRSFFTAMHQE